MLCLTVVNLGELACGLPPEELPLLQGKLSMFHVLAITAEAALEYSKAFKRLRHQGTMVGTNDLRIAAVTLANKMPVVTRNFQDFTRIPGLRVVGY